MIPKREKLSRFLKGLRDNSPPEVEEGEEILLSSEQGKTRVRISGEDHFFRVRKTWWAVRAKGDAAAQQNPE